MHPAHNRSQPKERPRNKIKSGDRRFRKRDLENKIRDLSKENEKDIRGSHNWVTFSFLHFNNPIFIWLFLFYYSHKPNLIILFKSYKTILINTMNRLPLLLIFTLLCVGSLSMRIKISLNNPENKLFTNSEIDSIKNIKLMIDGNGQYIYPQAVSHNFIEMYLLLKPDLLLMEESILSRQFLMNICSQCSWLTKEFKVLLK